MSEKKTEKPAATRPYLIRNAQGEAVLFVVASSQAQALRHAVNGILSATVASASDVLQNRDVAHEVAGD